MSEPTIDDFPALGFIPCPGDTDAMDAIADAFSDTAGRLEEVNAVLSGADEGEWRGLTAVAFRDMLDGDLRPKVQTAYQSFSDAYRALANWSQRMWEDQEAARALEADAAAAKADMEAAQTGLEGIPDPTGEDPPEDETDEEHTEREQNERDRDNLERDARIAEAALSEFRDRARELQEAYFDAGRDTATLLQDAIDLAPNEPGFWGKMAEAVSGFVDGVMDALADMGDMLLATLEAIAPVLAVINNVLGIIGTALSIASIFFPALAPFALAFGVLTLITTYAQKVGETGSFTKALTNPSVLASAAGVVLGGAAAGLAKAAGPTMTTVNSMDNVAGFVMRPAGVYVSQGVSNAMRCQNALTGSTYGLEVFNTFVNPEGSHLGNIINPGTAFTTKGADTSQLLR